MQRLLAIMIVLSALMVCASCSDDTSIKPDGDIDGDHSDTVDGDGVEAPDGDEGETTDGDVADETPVDPDNACLSIGDDSTPVMDLSADPTRLFGVDTTAMNTMAQTKAPLTMRMHAPLTANRCGSAGLVYIEPENDDLRYLDLSDTGLGEIVDAEVSFKNKGLALLFDKACTPLIVTLDSDDGLVVHSRQSDGSWVKTSDNAGLPTDGGWLSLVTAKTETTGKLSVFGHWQSGDTTSGLLWENSGEAEAAWSLRSFSLPVQGEIYDYACGADDSIHAVYPAVNTYPCDPCDNDLYWARLEDGGDWTREVVQDSVWGDPDDRFADQASLVVVPGGEPVVAACYQTRVITGSLKTSELRVYSRKDNDWCYEIVATQQDGYAGADGETFTGQNPQIRLDDNGHPFVLFHDLTEWHSSGMANGIAGQPRLAVRSKQGWTIATLLKQPGQVESPNPLNGFKSAFIAPLPDGSAVYLAGVEFKWETDSIYNQTDMPINYKLFIRKALLTWQ